MCRYNQEVEPNLQALSDDTEILADGDDDNKQTAAADDDDDDDDNDDKEEEAAGEGEANAVDMIAEDED